MPGIGVQLVIRDGWLVTNMSNMLLPWAYTLISHLLVEEMFHLFGVSVAMDRVSVPIYVW